MPSTTLIFILAVAIIFVGLVIATIWILTRSKKKPAPSSPPAPPPAEPPKFINDPPEARRVSAPVDIKPFRAETPLPQAADSGKIRILVVDDNVGTTENVSRLIYFEDDMEVIGQAYNGVQGVEMAAKLKPHIVLMDINMPDMDGITATREMRERAAFSQIIIMSVQADPEYMRQAMAAGARDFQPKPFSADELVNCIRRVYKIGLPTYRSVAAGEAHQKRMPSPIPADTSSDKPAATVGDAPVVVIYSPKGGTGTSSIATNLALAWQRAHGDITLMDGDLQFGDVFVHLNIRGDRGMGDLSSIPDIDADIVSQVLVAHPSGLNLLLPPDRPEMAELLTPPMLSQIVAHLKSSARVLVIDTSSMLSDQTLTLLDAADFILVNTTPDLPSVKNSKLFLDLLIDLNISYERVGVLVNRADMFGGIPPAEIKNLLKVERLYAIPNDPDMPSITNRGEIVITKKADSPIGNALRTISEAVWQYISAQKNGDGAPPSP